jgi:hypothetical protein
MILFGMFLGLLWGLYLLLLCTPQGVGSFTVPQYALLAVALAIAWVCLRWVASLFRK